MSKTVTLSFSDEQKVHVEPCDCCERTTIVIETSECLVRLGGLTPAELIELADALSDVASDQALMDDLDNDDFDLNSEWN